MPDGGGELNELGDKGGGAGDYQQPPLEFVRLAAGFASHTGCASEEIWVESPPIQRTRGCYIPDATLPDLQPSLYGEAYEGQRGVLVWNETGVTCVAMGIVSSLTPEAIHKRATDKDMATAENEAARGTGSGRLFARVYHALLVVLVLAALCCTMIIPISFILYGIDLSLRDSYSVEAFQAWRTTATFRRAFGYFTLGVALVMVALWVPALVRWRMGRRDVHPLLATVVMVAAGTLALLMFAGLVAPSRVF